MKKGKLIVISGPSGVGKGTIRENMKFKNYEFSISSTTREKREGEIDGEHYHFITPEQFEKKIKNDEMLEYATFVGNYYGTDKTQVMEKLSKGINVLLEIECQGAMQVIEKMPEVISIFIVPPSIEELEHRLRTRGTETDEKIALRLKKATEELKLKDKYKYVVLNDNLEHATKVLDEILFKEIDGV